MAFFASVGLLTAGCALTRPKMDRELMADRGAAVRNENVIACYLVRCPDVLDIQVSDRRDLSGKVPVDSDGHILLGRKRIRVDGQSIHEVERRVALATGCNQTHVRVKVVDFESQHVYLCGPGVGVQRAVEYRGPETVLDLLQRAGGITAGAAPNDVCVVRPRVIDDQAPEIIHINLNAILLNDDYQTNARLQPFDQVYIGETRQASFQKCVPPCFRPLYEAFCGLARR